MSQLDWYLSINLKARQLRLLVALDDFRNLGQVAANSCVTLPAVSKALAELEKGLGVKLFERTTHGLRPTIYGQCLIRHARTVLSDLNLASEELKGLMSGAAGKIHIGTLPAVISTLLPTALALFKQRTPAANVLIAEGTMSTLLPDLRLGKLDMIIGRLPPTLATHDLEEKVLVEAPVTLIARRAHPLVSKPALQWSDLGNFPWILPPPGSLLREPLENVLAHHELAMPCNYIETLSTHLIRAYLQLSDAIAIFAGHLPSGIPDLDFLSALPLELGLVTRPIGAIWNRDKPLTPSANLMLSCLAEVSQPAVKKAVPMH
jgi:DNA-binding transcriptional LysR family regulator